VAEDGVHAAYLRRLGLDHAPEPTLQTLVDLHARHLARIPSENLGIMLGRPRSVAPQAGVRRVAAVRRLGYCFHQNGAALLLLGLGYHVEHRHGQVWVDVVGVPLGDGPVDALRHLYDRMLADHRAWVAAGRP
jgi:arylamine N-acetyltransferase